MAKKADVDKAKAGRPSNESKYGEVGFTGLKQFGGLVQEEFVRKLSGPRGAKFFKEFMENDPIASAMLFAIERVMVQTSWQIIRGGETAKDKEAAEFVKSCMTDMSHTWHNFIQDVLTMFPYGWAYFEQVYKIRRGKSSDSTLHSKFTDGRIGWRKFGLRSQDTLLKWEFDDHGGIQGMWQSAGLIGGSAKSVFIPIGKSLLFRTTTAKNNPEGKSLLRGAARSYAFKKVLEELEGIGVERDLVGLPMLEPPEDFDILQPENADTVAWAKKTITHLRRDEMEGVLVPPKWKLTLLGSPGEKQFDVDKIINRYDKRISMTTLQQWLMLGMDRTGSYAQSKNQTDMFFLSCIGWGDLIAEVVNKYAIDPLMALNPEFAGLEANPKIAPARIGLPDLEKIAQYVFKLARVGGFENDDESQDFFRRLLHMQEAPSRDIRIAGDFKKRPKTAIPIRPAVPPEDME